MPVVPALLELSENLVQMQITAINFGQENIETRYLLRCAVCLKDTTFNKSNVRDLIAKMLAQFRFHTEKNQVTLQGSKNYFLHYCSDITCEIKAMSEK